jgi:hypothetical protein
VERAFGPLCTNRPIRQDYLDEFVRSEIILLDDPSLIQAEVDRRRETAQKADLLCTREGELRREQPRVEKSSERLVTAYQGVHDASQLRQRKPAFQKQTQAVESELESMKVATVNKTKYLQLAESLAGFRSKPRVRAEALDFACDSRCFDYWSTRSWWEAAGLDGAIRSRCRIPGGSLFIRRRSPNQSRTQSIFCFDKGQR